MVNNNSLNDYLKSLYQELVENIEALETEVGKLCRKHGLPHISGAKAYVVLTPNPIQSNAAFATGRTVGRIEQVLEKTHEFDGGKVSEAMRKTFLGGDAKTLAEYVKGDPPKRIAELLADTASMNTMANQGGDIGAFLAGTYSAGRLEQIEEILEAVKAKELELAKDQSKLAAICSDLQDCKAKFDEFKKSIIRVKGPNFDKLGNQRSSVSGKVDHPKGVLQEWIENWIGSPESVSKPVKNPAPKSTSHNPLNHRGGGTKGLRIDSEVSKSKVLNFDEQINRMQYEGSLGSIDDMGNTKSYTKLSDTKLVCNSSVNETVSAYNSSVDEIVRTKNAHYTSFIEEIPVEDMSISSVDSNSVYMDLRSDHNFNRILKFISSNRKKIIATLILGTIVYIVFKKPEYAKKFFRRLNKMRLKIKNSFIGRKFRAIKNHPLINNRVVKGFWTISKYARRAKPV